MWRNRCGGGKLRLGFESRVGAKRSHRRVNHSNPDDSGSVNYTATLPVLGLRWQLAPQVQVFASAGRGLGSPTLNEVAYRTTGGTGFNTSLLASSSSNIEAGLRGRHGVAAWSATFFDTKTKGEIVVLTNSGGRSTFQNAGRTHRRGLELSGDVQLGSRLMLSLAWTVLNATYSDAFKTCDSSPCTTVPLRPPTTATPQRRQPTPWPIWVCVFSKTVALGNGVSLFVSTISPTANTQAP